METSSRDMVRPDESATATEIQEWHATERKGYKIRVVNREGKGMDITAASVEAISEFFEDKPWAMTPFPLTSTCDKGG